MRPTPAHDYGYAEDARASAHEPAVVYPPAPAHEPVPAYPPGPGYPPAPANGDTATPALGYAAVPAALAPSTPAAPDLAGYADAGEATQEFHIEIEERWADESADHAARPDRG